MAPNKVIANANETTSNSINPPAQRIIQFNEALFQPELVTFGVIHTCFVFIASCECFPVTHAVKPHAALYTNRL